MKPGIAFPHLLTFEPGEYVRNTKLGGSDIAAVIGLGATYDGVQQTPYTVWCRKTGRTATVIDPGRERFLSRRKRFEPLIIEMLKEEFGAEIVSLNEQYIDAQHPFLTAEIDFAWRDPETGEIGNGEIKTVSPLAFGERFGWGEPGTQEVPIHYGAQVVHGMGITGARKAILGALVGFDTMLFYPFERDEALITDMREKAAAFWCNHVMANIEPEPITLLDVQRQLLMRKGRPTELTPEMAEILAKIKELSDRQKSDADAETELRFKLFMHVRQAWMVPDGTEMPHDNALLNYGGKTIAKWGRQRGTSLDQKRLKAEQPEIALKYTREHFSRILRFLKAK